MRKFMAMVATVGRVACGGEKAATQVDGATQTADAQTEEVKGDASTADAGDNADSSAVDAGADSGNTPAQKLCAQIAQDACAGLATCCGQAPADCLAKWTEQCLAGKPANQALNDAIDAGDVTLNPAAEASCTTAVASVGTVCTYAAIDSAAFACKARYLDNAKVGDVCLASAPIGCGAGKGRCVVVQPPDGYKCLSAHSKGDSCSTTQPCEIGLECLNGSLTRSLTCGEPGSTCNLSDKCATGFDCQSGKCVRGPPVKEVCKP